MAPFDRGGDRGVAEVQFGTGRPRPRLLHRRRGDALVRPLLVQLVGGDVLLGEQGFVSTHLGHRPLVGRLRAGPCGAGHVEVGLERLGVDAEQHLALLDRLPLLERALQQEPPDARADLDDLRRLGLPQETRAQRNVLRLHDHHVHWHRRRRRRRGLRGGALLQPAPNRKAHAQQHHQHQHRDPPADEVL